jgi:predicted RNA-binding Zn-ribbon protein involved in translation (DUF1610 family)
VSPVVREWIVEAAWDCPACGKENLGRYTSCQGWDGEMHTER